MPQTRAAACTGSAEVQTVVPVVQRPDSDAPNAFPGLYLSVLPAQPFTGPSTLLLTSQWRSSTDIVRVDLDTGKAQSLRPGNTKGAWSLLTIGHGVQTLPCMPVLELQIAVPAV